MTLVFSTTNTEDGGHWEGNQVRNALPKANLTDPGITSGLVRVTFLLIANGSNSAAITDAYIGTGITSPEYNFDGSQVQLLFGGSASSGTLTGSQSVTSDFVPFTYTYATAVSLVVSLYWTGTRAESAQVSGIGTHFYTQVEASGTEGSTAPGGTFIGPSGGTQYVTTVEFVAAGAALGGGPRRGTAGRIQPRGIVPLFG